MRRTQVLRRGAYLSAALPLLLGLALAAEDPLWLTDADAERIAASRSTTRLDLSFSLIGDAGMERLRGMKGVTELDLYAAEHITDTAIAYIRDWKTLRKLNLRGTDVTD